MERLYLLDAYALIYRAYYGLIASPIINSKHQNTSAIYGFVNTLDEILRKEQPDFVAVAFDVHGPTFRHEAYADYKAQREAQPEDITRAVPVIKDIIRAYRIPILEKQGFEADDVIGTMAKRAVGEGVEVRMITPDKDYAQLVEDHILLQRPSRGAQPWEVLGPSEVCAKYGLPTPLAVIDYLALMGDASDNIPGCPGVGPKTASKLIAQFGSVENLLARTDELKGAQKQRVEENAEQIRFSKFLATIKTDVPLDVELSSLRRQEPDTKELLRIFDDLEFRTFAKRLKEGAPKPEKKQPEMLDLFADFAPTAERANFDGLLEGGKTGVFTTQLVDTETLAKENFCTLFSAKKIGMATFASNFEPMSGEMVGMSFALDDGRAFYVSLPSDENLRRALLEIYRPLFESEQIEKIGHDLKRDVLLLARCGIELRGPLFDTMLAHYVVQPELQHDLFFLSEHYPVGGRLGSEERFGPKGKDGARFSTFAPAEVSAFACRCAELPLRLRPLLEQEMRASGVERVFGEIEMPLMPVLARMELQGVRLDTDILSGVGEGFAQRLDDIEKEIYRLAGHPFLISSPRQVGEVLFDELRISEKAKKTKSGQYSTNEEILQGLKAAHPIVGQILEHRKLKKLLSTYIDALPKLINPRTGHIHTNFNQAVTATGRLSSSNPNLQNIPVRGEDGREIRKAFVPEPGQIFFSADYSQIELRIMAHLSQDPHLVEAFREGHDIHAATAARIFKKPIADVSRDERRKAKTANFGIIYGISAFGLAERMEVPRSEAKTLIDSYFLTYPKVAEFIERSKEAARQRGYIETEFGRRRYLPDINSRNAVVRGYAERNAVNAPIQGTAADIIKIAMIRIDRRLRAEGFQSKMILQVHDELNFSVVPDELDRLRALVIEEMQGACPLRVPLEADCGTGANWLEAH